MEAAAKFHQEEYVLYNKQTLQNLSPSLIYIYLTVLTYLPHSSSYFIIPSSNALICNAIMRE